MAARPEIGDRPRFEHPRPDFHRGMREGTDWLCLNGWWQFEFDPDNRGLEEEWFEAGEFSRLIRVPFPWQSLAAWGSEAQAGNESWFAVEAYLNPDEAKVEGAAYRDAAQHEIGWYRRRFTVPAGWFAPGRRIFLNIGAADWHAVVWLNGRKLGEAESGYIPICFDATEALQEGDNELVVRVFDPMDHARQPVGKQYAWYTRTSGIWQTVWLEPRGAAYIDSARIVGDPESGLVRVRLELQATEPVTRTRLSLTIALAGQPIAAVQQSIGEVEGRREVEVALRVPTVRSWTPDEPHLYDATLTLEANLSDGTPVRDTVNCYFGFRTVTIGPLRAGGPNYICLNGRPIYLRGCLDQSFNPWGVYTFPTDEAIRRDIELAKEAGFNFIRLHIKIEEPRWYYWCDKLGMLVMQDMPNFGYDGYSPVARKRWEATMRAAIRRDFNHPCIIAWCLFNETWGLGGEKFKRLRHRQRWVAEMYCLAKQLDSTRPVEDNSPCLNDHVVTDINSWHFYINDYAAASEHIRKVVEQTHPGSNFNYCPGKFQRDEPLMNSEYGGISAGMGDMDVSWAFRMLTNELRYHEKICGYVYTELMDIEWERNGFYNYDRTAKQFGYNPALLQGEQFIGFSGPPGRTVRAGEPVALRWWLRGPAPEGRVRAVFRAQRYNALAELDGDWIEAVHIDDWISAALGEFDLQLPDELTSRPGLVWLWAELVDAKDRVLAGNFAVVEVVGEFGVPNAMLVDLAAARAERFEKTERGTVDGSVEFLAGAGVGRFEFDVAVPEGRPALEILAEISSWRPGAPQTDHEAVPSVVRICVGGEEVHRVRIGNQYADARGALSHMHGLAGRYGELVRCNVPRELVAKYGADGRLRLSIEALEEDGTGGVCIYGRRAGRWPCGLVVRWAT